jgi:hypothetical protein
LTHHGKFKHNKRHIQLAPAIVLRSGLPIAIYYQGPVRRSAPFSKNFFHVFLDTTIGFTYTHLTHILKKQRVKAKGGLSPKSKTLKGNSL